MLVVALLALVYHPPAEYVKWNESLYQDSVVGSKRKSLPAQHSAVLYFEEPNGVLSLTSSGSYLVHIGLVDPAWFKLTSDDWYVYDGVEKGFILMGNHKAIVELYAQEDTEVSYTACFMGEATVGLRQYTKLVPGSRGTYDHSSLDANERIGYLLTDDQASASFITSNIPNYNDVTLTAVGPDQKFKGNTTQQFNAGDVYLLDLEVHRTINCSIQIVYSGGSRERLYETVDWHDVKTLFGLFTRTASLTIFPEMTQVPPRPYTPTPGPSDPGPSGGGGLGGGYIALIVVVVLVVVGAVTATIVICVCRRPEGVGNCVSFTLERYGMLNR